MTLHQRMEFKKNIRRQNYRFLFISLNNKNKMDVIWLLMYCKAWGSKIILVTKYNLLRIKFS